MPVKDQSRAVSNQEGPVASTKSAAKTGSVQVTPAKPKGPRPKFANRGAQQSTRNRPLRTTTNQSTRSRRPSRSKAVEQLEYYHGLLPKDYAEELLKNQGEFLIRRTKDEAAMVDVVSIRWDKTVRHLKIQSAKNKTEGTMRYFIDKKEFGSVGDLIDFYLHKSEQVGKCKAILMSPIPKQEWEVRHDEIRLDKKIGEGAFGEVHLAYLTLTNSEDPKPIKVAVKKSRNTATLAREKMMELMVEARTQQKFKHKNVVRLLGIAAEKPPLMIVLEFVPNGSLDKYMIKKTAELTALRCVKMCHGAASGLEYLHSMQFIHRDIAARNCLVAVAELIKITDFGLTKEGGEGTTGVKMGACEKVPIKWAAIETLTDRVFTPKTDVWAFGVLLWEVFGHCKEEPYPGMTTAEVREAIRNTDYRMDPPDGMPDKMAEVMRSCWEKDPEKRPDCEKIVLDINDISKAMD